MTLKVSIEGNNRTFVHDGDTTLCEMLHTNEALNKIYAKRFANVHEADALLEDCLDQFKSFWDASDKDSTTYKFIERIENYLNGQ